MIGVSGHTGSALLLAAPETPITTGGPHAGTTAGTGTAPPAVRPGQEARLISDGVPGVVSDLDSTASTWALTRPLKSGVKEADHVGPSG